MSGGLLLAPILEEGETSRSVYFPKMNWYDFYTGKRYLKDTTTIINCSLTDTVPIFILEGCGVLTQNIDKVRNTDDLTNAPFIFTGGLITNEDDPDQVYRSRSYVASFRDHNN